MAVSKEGLGLTVLGLLIFAGVFVFWFHGLTAPLAALSSMLYYLAVGSVIAFSLLFVLIGLLIALA